MSLFRNHPEFVAVERDAAIVKICVNSVLLVASLIGLYAAAMGEWSSVHNPFTWTAGKACLLLPYIILEFLQLVAFGALFATVVSDGRWARQLNEM